MNCNQPSHTPSRLAFKVMSRIEPLDERATGRNVLFPHACPKGTIYQDVFIYIKFYISISRLDYTYQDLHTGKTRFQYTYQDPLASTSSLINIDQLPLTRIDNQI